MKDDVLILDFSKYSLSSILDNTKYDTNVTWQNDVFNFISLWKSRVDYIKLNTSGTTGKRKEIKLSKNDMIISAKRTCEYFSLKSSDQVLLCLSPEYIAGMMMIVRSIVANLKLVIVKPCTNPLQVYNSKYSFAAFVPMQFQAIINTNIRLLNMCDTIIVGGGGIKSELLNSISNIDTKIFSTYGMTETITHIAVSQLYPVFEESYNTLGGVSITNDSRGCLIVNDEKMKKIVPTNDVCEVLSDSEFRFKGRIDNVINSGGVKLFPEEIEKKIEDCINHEFYIKSEHDNILGEKVVLCIEASEELYDIQNLHVDLRLRLNKYEIPRSIKFYYSFGRTSSGKVIRR